MKIYDTKNLRSLRERQLSPEISLVQEMTDASFRQMDQDRMTECCLTGLVEIFGGQGSAILTEDMGEAWYLHLHLRTALPAEDLEIFMASCLKKLHHQGKGLGQTALNRVLVQPPETPAATQPLTEWTAIPLEAENNFLGFLILDLDGSATLPDSLYPVLHQLCTGLLAIRNMRQLLITDPMTGSYNRWFMDVELSKFCENLSANSDPFAVLVMDIDHFKSINDRQGHACGDQVLMEFAELLRQRLQNGDASIRMGGDEFLLWFPHQDKRDLQAFGQELLAGIQKTLRSPKNPDEKITSSMGLVVHDPSKESISKEQLLDRADHALYTSKRRGRNQLTVWTPELEKQPWLWSDEESGGPDDIRALQSELNELKNQSIKDQDCLVELLTNILSIKEFETGLHSHRVAKITACLLEKLDLTSEEKTAIHRGAMLHDIGKIAIPEAILHKEGPLTEHEWLIVKQHPRLGHRFIENQNFLKSAGDIILYHHEQFDGKGYPRGLKGKEIPHGARLFSVVDAYDSMRANRVYKPFTPKQQVVEELQRKSGTQFDPDMLNFFMEHLDAIEAIGRWEE